MCGELILLALCDATWPIASTIFLPGLFGDPCTIVSVFCAVKCFRTMDELSRMLPRYVRYAVKYRKRNHFARDQQCGSFYKLPPFPATQTFRTGTSSAVHVIASFSVSGLTLDSKERK